MCSVKPISEVLDADVRTYEHDYDEYQLRATRTLFIGNLEKETTVDDLVEKFSPFGDILVSGRVFDIPKSTLFYICNASSTFYPSIHPYIHS